MSQVINDTLQLNANRPIDARTMFLDGSVYRPYTSAAEANATINIAYRFKGMLVPVDLVGVGLVLHWYKTGVTNSDLVPLDNTTSDTNFANTNLTFDSDRVHNFNGHSLTFEMQGANSFYIHGSDGISDGSNFSVGGLLGDAGNVYCESTRVNVPIGAGHSGFLSYYHPKFTSTTKLAIGINSAVYHETGSVLGIYGTYSYVQAGATATNTYNYRGVMLMTPGGHVTNAYAFSDFPGDTQPSSGATVQNYYGLYLATPTLNYAITTYYGVYQQNPAAKNLFAGTLQLSHYATADATKFFGIDAAGNLVLRTPAFTGGGGGGTDTNFGTTDITFTADRNHNANLKYLEIINLGHFKIKALDDITTPTVSSELYTASNQIQFKVTNETTADYNNFTVSLSGGFNFNQALGGSSLSVSMVAAANRLGTYLLPLSVNGVTADITGNITLSGLTTDTNFANTPLTASGDLVHDWAEYNLGIQNLSGLTFLTKRDVSTTRSFLALTPGYSVLGTDDTALGHSRRLNVSLDAVYIERNGSGPFYIATSVNGVAADITGNVTISTGGGGVGTLQQVTDLGSTTNHTLTINKTTGSGRDYILRAYMSDAGNNQFWIGNSTGTAGQFNPSFGGYIEGSDNGLAFRSLVNPTDDAPGTTVAMISMALGRTSSATDPANGTFSAIVNKPLFDIGNYSTTVFRMSANGSLNLNHYINTDATKFATFNSSGDMILVSATPIYISAATSFASYDNTNATTIIFNDETVPYDTVKAGKSSGVYVWDASTGDYNGLTGKWKLKAYTPNVEFSGSTRAYYHTPAVQIWKNYAEGDAAHPPTFLLLHNDTADMPTGTYVNGAMISGNGYGGAIVFHQGGSPDRKLRLGLIDNTGLFYDGMEVHYSAGGNTLINRMPMVPGSASTQSVGTSTLPFGSAAFGGISLGYVAKTAAYTTTSTDCTIGANSTTAAFNVTLGTLSANTIQVVIKTDASANAVTVVGTINGVANYALTAQYKFVVLQNIGSNNWLIIGKN